MNWTCPFCQRDQVVTASQHTSVTDELALKVTRFGSCGYGLTAIACSNKECGEVMLHVRFGKGTWVRSPLSRDSFQLIQEGVEFFRLRPASFVKPQPKVVPDALAKDYYEACAIRDLSPKASATLSRRVLQGMLRDFCGVTGPNLYQEIEALKKLADEGRAPSGVASETIDAMHSVRSVGNIGAHMEQDIDCIVDVDPNEAQALIELIEMLFEEWYVEREKRKGKLAAIKAIGAAKTEAKALAQKKGVKH